MDEDDRKRDVVRIVDEKVAQLAEHFDTVQVFVTRQEGTQTHSYWTGTGNWYARIGQVGEWLETTSARACREATRIDDENED